MDQSWSAESTDFLVLGMPTIGYDIYSNFVCVTGMQILS